MMHKNQGFTLLELIITVAIVGIAAAVAIPNFRSMVQDSRLSATANDLLASLNYARSEAVGRNARVTVCRSSDGAACSTDSTVNWNAGWIVFVDGGVVGTIDGSDTILRVQGAVAATRVRGDGTVTDNVSYVSSGQTARADGSQQTGTINVCSSSGRAKSRNIVFRQGSGWAGISTDATALVCSAT